MSAISELQRISVNNEAELHHAATRLAHALKRGDCLRLEGTLGMGKTSFCRALIRALSTPDTDVSSPTFTLLQSYPITLPDGAAEFWHADLYRLESAHALEEIGLHELPSQGVLAVEWPAIANDWLPPDALHIQILPGAHDDAREIHYSSAAPAAWATRLAAAS